MKEQNYQERQDESTSLLSQPRLRACHLDYVYFPTTAIVSLLYTMENGSSAEMGLTGNNGVVGIALFMGGGTMPNRAAPCNSRA